MNEVQPVPIVVQVADLVFPLACADADGIRPEEILRAVAARLSVRPSRLSGPKLLRVSVDARRKQDIRLNCSASVLFEATPKEASGLTRLPGISLHDPPDPATAGLPPVRSPLPPDAYRTGHPPVVVGAGPAGLFAALLLARAGLRPVVLERGPSIRERTARVAAQWQRGTIEPDCNTQFGEGGAGAFSDGKLTTRIHDARCAAVLSEFVLCGAPEEILFRARPHVGTDRLLSVVEGLRGSIVAAGGTFRFDTRFEGPVFRNGRLVGVLVRDVSGNGSEEVPTRTVVLAPGHSARDTFETLFRLGIAMEPKPFSIGARIEHLQELVDAAQFGPAAGHPALGHAEYQFHEPVGDRTVYTFCMCPGGTVVAAATEPKSIVVNGMSRFRRDGPNANSALVVSVSPADFDGSDPLAGIRFQRRWEQAAFRIGEGAAPVQRVGVFVGRGAGEGRVDPTYAGPTFEADLAGCLPDVVLDAMRTGILAFDRKLRGFASGGAMLTGVETRTSSPLRILRNEGCESVSHPGIFPCGEGAGYAGGIVSAAVDGLRVAEAVLERSRMRPDR